MATSHVPASETVQALIEASHVLAANGQEHTVFGHTSIRLPGGDSLLLKGAGIGLGELEPDKTVVIDLDGEVLSGTARRHLEFPIHTEIYRARPDVHAVVHTHPTAAATFSALAVEPRPLAHEGCWFAPHGVPCFTLTGDLIYHSMLGEALAGTLGKARGALLRNHGLVSVGATLEEAAIGALFLDKMCAMHLLAGNLPVEPSPSTEAVAKRLRMYHGQAVEDIWAWYVRELHRNRAYT